MTMKKMFSNENFLGGVETKIMKFKNVEKCKTY